jgi:hypothetical protein
MICCDLIFPSLLSAIPQVSSNQNKVGRILPVRDANNGAIVFVLNQAKFLGINKDCAR